MLVTFHSNAWSTTTLFGEVAIALLKMAGHSGTVPSAMLAADIPAAIAKLKQGLAAVAPAEKQKSATQADFEDEHTAPHVELATRAQPLLQLLEASATQGCDVTWEAGAPVI
jgi:hypothetical protein